MALVLKATKTIINPHTGAAFSTAYCRVRYPQNDKGDKSHQFYTQIFVSQADSNAKRREFQHELAQNFIISVDDFDTFFSIVLQGQAGNNLMKLSYVWLAYGATIEDSIDLIFADWESDE